MLHKIVQIPAVDIFRLPSRWVGETEAEERFLKGLPSPWQLSNMATRTQENWPGGNHKNLGIPHSNLSGKLHVKNQGILETE